MEAMIVKYRCGCNDPECGYKINETTLVAFVRQSPQDGLALDQLITDSGAKIVASCSVPTPVPIALLGDAIVGSIKDIAEMNSMMYNPDGTRKPLSEVAANLDFMMEGDPNAPVTVH